MSFDLNPPPAKREWRSFSYGSPEMIICALANFTQAGEEGLGATTPKWYYKDLLQRAADWRASRTHPDDLLLPTDPRKIILHRSFLHAHGIYTEIDVFPGARIGYPEGCIQVLISDFNLAYGEGAIEAVIYHVIEHGDTDTYELRRQWDASQRASEPSLIGELGRIPRPIRLPAATVAAGAALTVLESNVGTLIALFEFELVLGIPVLILGGVAFVAGLTRVSPKM